ncbi:MAG: recombinase family protein [bacterium]|nr:recombinase family protein [bacterium]
MNSVQIAMNDKMPIRGQATRASMYARVSSEQQVQENTIASQVEALHQRIQEDRLACDEELRFVDEGYSGSTLMRPALEQLRDVAAAGGIDRLYVHSPDRLARKYAYQVLLVDELQRCGVELVFLNRPVGESPEEDLLLQVQGMISEYERAKIMERSRRGKRHTARCGHVNVMSGAPYGYRYVSRHEGGGEASYAVVLDQARVVQQIFEWVGQERLSMCEVSRRLARQGILSPRSKGLWDRSTIWGILKNPAYKGAAAFGKTRAGQMRPRLRPQRGRAAQPRRARGVYDTPPETWIYIPVPAIVSEALFDAVAKQLHENRTRQRRRKRGASHLLQGLLVCEDCGYAFTGRRIRRSNVNGKRCDYTYYRCGGKDGVRFGGQPICHNRQMKADLLETAVWEDVCSLLSEPERLEEEFERRINGRDQDDRLKGGQSLAKQIQCAKRAIARLIDVYKDGLLERSEFEPRIKQVKERLSQLEADAKREAEQEEHEQNLRLVFGKLEEFADKVRERLQEADWMTKREIISALVDRVEVGRDKVRILYRVNPSTHRAVPDMGRLQDCGRREGATPGSRLLDTHYPVGIELERERVSQFQAHGSSRSMPSCRQIRRNSPSYVNT